MDAREIVWQEEEMNLRAIKATGGDISDMKQDFQGMPSEMYERIFGEKKADSCETSGTIENATTKESQSE